jgi:NAD+ synthase (glutamine-hydrolysing)
MEDQLRPFNSLYSHGYARVAVCVPRVKVAEPAFNAERTLALAQQADADKAVLALFPEMGLSAYSNDDLFHQDALLDATEAALGRIVQESTPLVPILVVGAPLRFENKLFNCAVVIQGGRILGVVPKSYLPNYREFYERRQFAPASAATLRDVRLLGQDAPFGPDIIYEAADLEGFALHGKCVAAYLYTAAGQGESTTDLAWDGHAMVYENGNLLAESQRFADSEQRITADIDLDRLRQERMRWTTLTDSASIYREKLARFRRVRFDLMTPLGEVPLRRAVQRPEKMGRPLLGNLRDPGIGPPQAAGIHGHQEARDRGFGRA